MPASAASADFIADLETTDGSATSRSRMRSASGDGDNDGLPAGAGRRVSRVCGQRVLMVAGSQKRVRHQTWAGSRLHNLTRTSLGRYVTYRTYLSHDIV
jgi:hypothetical protein